MSRPKIVAISSSISESSKTATFLDHVTDRFDQSLFDVTAINLRDIPPASYFRYPVEDPALLDEPYTMLEETIKISDAKPELPPLVREVITEK